MPNEKSNANIGFEKEIWDAACVLWGHIPAADYRKVIVGLIFLRYVSCAFDKRHKVLVEEGDGFEDDKDAYTAENVFYVPETARWSVIASAAHTPEIGKVIDEAMKAIEVENPALKNVLPKNYNNPDLDKRVLGEVVDLFTNNIRMDDVDQGRDLLGRTYEYCIAQFAAYEGVKGGEFYTPSSIVKTIVAILKPFNSKPVQNYDRADPFRRKVFCGQCGSLFICQGRTNCTHDFATLAFVCGKATRTNRRECRNKLQRIGTLEDSFMAVFNYLLENRSVLSDIVTDNEEFNEVTARLEELRESEKKYFELEVKELMNEQMTKNHTKLVGEMLRLEDKRKAFLTRNYEISACNQNLKKFQKVLKTAKPMTTMDAEMCDLFVKRIMVMDRNNLIFELTSGHKIKVEVLDFYKTRDEIRRVYVTE